jgi:hypothetical protein
MKKNYNRLALQGVEIDDMEFVEEFNLNPDLAYTPKLNDVLLETMYRKNIDSFVKDGIEMDKAKSKAGRLRAQAKNDIAQLLK